MWSIYIVTNLWTRQTLSRKIKHRAWSGHEWTETLFLRRCYFLANNYGVVYLWALTYHIWGGAIGQGPFFYFSAILNQIFLINNIFLSNYTLRYIIFRVLLNININVWAIYLKKPSHIAKQIDCIFLKDPLLSPMFIHDNVSKICVYLDTGIHQNPYSIKRHAPKG